MHLLDRAEEPPMTAEQRIYWLRHVRPGDWLFYEYELHQYGSDGVSDGYCFKGYRIDSYTDDVRAPIQPLDMRIKRISASFSSASKLLHKLESRVFNHPGLHRLLVRYWTSFCNGELPRAEAGEWPFKFVKVIEEGAVEVDGVPVLR